MEEKRINHGMVFWIDIVHDFQNTEFNFLISVQNYMRSLNKEE